MFIVLQNESAVRREVRNGEQAVKLKSVCWDVYALCVALPAREEGFLARKCWHSHG